jgi:Zn ribbon nucleic-acid-binding protein
MSIRHIVELQCPTCGVKGNTEIWYTINVDIDPEAKKQLLEGKINIFQCNHCGYRDIVPVQLLYHDMKKRFCAQFVPFFKTEDKDFLDSLAGDAKPRLPSKLPEHHVPEYFSNIHCVFSMDELVRYVVFRDRVAQHKASVND